MPGLVGGGIFAASVLQALAPFSSARVTALFVLTDVIYVDCYEAELKRTCPYAIDAVEAAL